MSGIEKSINTTEANANFGSLSGATAGNNNLFFNTNTVTLVIASDNISSNANALNFKGMITNNFGSLSGATAGNNDLFFNTSADTIVIADDNVSPNANALNFKGMITNNILGTIDIMSPYNNLGAINFNTNPLSLNTNNIAVTDDTDSRNGLSIIEISNGGTLTILDKNFPPVLITLKKNAKVNFIYEDKEFIFTNHYQDKMVFSDIKILAEMSSLPHKEFAKILSNDYTLETIQNIKNQYKEIDKETLNLFVGQNHKLFDSSYLDSHKEFFEDYTLF